MRDPNCTIQYKIISLSSTQKICRRCKVGVTVKSLQIMHVLLSIILNPPIGVDYEKQSKQERQVVRDSAQVPRGDVHPRAQIHLREGGKARRKGLLDSRRFWGFDHGDRAVLPSKYPSKGYDLDTYTDECLVWCPSGTIKYGFKCGPEGFVCLKF